MTWRLNFSHSKDHSEISKRISRGGKYIRGGNNLQVPFCHPANSDCNVPAHLRNGTYKTGHNYYGMLIRSHTLSINHFLKNLWPLPIFGKGTSNAVHVHRLTAVSASQMVMNYPNDNFEAFLIHSKATETNVRIPSPKCSPTRRTLVEHVASTATALWQSRSLRVAEDISVWWLGPRRFVTLVRSAVYKLSYLLTYPSATLGNIRHASYHTASHATRNKTEMN